MKKIILLLMFGIATGGVLFSQDAGGFSSILVEVGQQPLAIIPSRVAGSFDINPDTLNIICLGVDVNFNGVLDEGDELPSWWKIEGVNNANPYLPNNISPTARKVMDISANWNNLFPFRSHTVGTQDGITNTLHSMLLPIPSMDKVVFYDMATEKPAEIDGTALPTINDPSVKSIYTFGRMIFTTTPLTENWVNTKNTITMYKAHDFNKVMSYESDNKQIQRIICYTNPFINMENITIAVLYEESFGSEGTIEFHTSKVPFDAITADKSWEDCFDIKSIKVGVSINDMELQYLTRRTDIPEEFAGPCLFVVSSGDSRIYVINGITQELDGSCIGLTGEDYIQMQAEPSKIREINFKASTNDGYTDYISAVITSYDGNLYYIDDIYNPNSEQNLAFEGEGMCDAAYLFQNKRKLNGNLFCARTLNYANQEFPALYDNKVEIFYGNTTGILDFYSKLNALKAFPNPVIDIVNIELSEELIQNATATKVNDIALIDVSGQLIANITDYSLSGNTVTIRIPNVVAGSYIVRLSTNAGLFYQNLIKN